MSFKTCPAVYKLENNENGKIYVGGTRNARNRRADHFHELKIGHHRNPKLQIDFNAGNTFSFHVLEYLPIGTPDDFIVRQEQKWMEKLHPEYNSRNAVSLFGTDDFLSRERKLSGKRRMPQTSSERKKRSDSVKAWWAAHPDYHISDEHREAISKKMKGTHHPNWGKKTPKKVRNKISSSLCKYEYTFLDPQGVSYTFPSIREFCRIHHHLSNTTMYHLVKGIRQEYKGWTFVESHKR